MFIEVLILDMGTDKGTPQDRIIEQLESDIERQKLEIFELKGEIKILKQVLQDATQEIQKNQGYYDDDGNYIE